MTDPLDYAEDFPHLDLSVLTARQLEVVVMRYCGGMKWRAIAAAAGCSMRTVRKAHDRALRKVTPQLSHCSERSDNGQGQ